MALPPLARRVGLRLPLPLPVSTSPPAATTRRPFFTRVFNKTSKVEEQQARTVNLETASEEEIRRETRLLEEQIDEIRRRTRKEVKKLPGYLKHLWGSLKLSVGGLTVTKLMLFVDDVRRDTGSTHTSVEEPNKKCPCCGTHLHN